jgi:hypothetical protein
VDACFHGSFENQEAREGERIMSAVDMSLRVLHAPTVSLHALDLSVSTAFFAEFDRLFLPDLLSVRSKDSIGGIVCCEGARCLPPSLHTTPP